MLSTALLSLALFAPTDPLALACCDFLSDSACTPTSADDLSHCDPSSVMALCQIDEFGWPHDCIEVELQCCSGLQDAQFGFECSPHGPGLVCEETVVIENVQCR